MPEVGGERFAQRGELAVGVAVEVEHGSGEGLDDVPRDRLGDGCVFSLTLSAYRTCFCGAPYGCQPSQVVADREIAEVGHPAILSEAA